MAKPRGKRRRSQAEVVTAEATQVSVAATTPSYIRELSGDNARTAEPFAADLADDPRVVADQPAESSEPAEPMLLDTARIQAANDPNGVAIDDFERMLVSPRVIGRRTRSALIVAAGLGLVVALGWVVDSRVRRTDVTGARAIVPAMAARAATAIPTAVAQSVAVVPAPVAVVPPSAVVAPPASPIAPPAQQAGSAALALASEVIPAQPTERLTELLQDAVQARRRGALAASEALRAWLDAGGTDAQPVAQFAYWLGRRNNIQLAEQWAERATTMDPASQIAWYVLGATRLDDPRSRTAFEALRRCAAIQGRFTAECNGPINHQTRLRAPAAH